VKSDLIELLEAVEHHTANCYEMGSGELEELALSIRAKLEAQEKAELAEYGGTE